MGVSMNKIRTLISVMFIVILLGIAGCSNEVAKHPPADDRNGAEQQIEVESEEPDERESADIQLSPYAEEVGFSLTKPTTAAFETNTAVEIQGSIEQTEHLNEKLIWVVITPEEPLEEFPENEFNYYISLNDGKFSKKMILHQGKGDYQVSIRVPSNESNETEKYYEAAVFDVKNQDEEIQWDIEYTAYGVNNRIQLAIPEAGLENSKASVPIEGTVSEDYAGDMVLVQVVKANESRQILFPVKNQQFSGEAPLYFGEGIHEIRIQTYNESDELYYEAASLYADNQTAAVFAEMEKYNSYIDRGVTLFEPAWQTVSTFNQQEYPVGGEIDPNAPGAAEINYIIVTVKHLGKNLEAGYLIPVKDYQFEGLAYFRFGPGEYEVTINVPDLEQHDQSMFYYKGIAKIKHRVEGIEDNRDLLPSRGIESDHPAIIEKAEEITAGLNGDREKAKAIYEFVAKHVAYDVQKADDDIFNISDSAVSTLETGVGICQDYAFLATALLRAIGMESHYVEGYAGERHAWVETKIDGEWVEMDPTWGAGYVQDGEFHFHYNEEYFDPDPALLAKTHTREGILY